MSIDFGSWADREYAEEKECLDDLKKIAGQEKANTRVTDKQALSFLQEKIAVKEISPDDLKHLESKCKQIKKKGRHHSPK